MWHENEFSCCLFNWNTNNNRRPLFLSEAPKERPRLKLLPKQAEKTENGEDKETSTKSSIFGSAKPVDTAKKEAEIDQKLQVRFFILDKPIRDKV